MIYSKHLLHSQCFFHLITPGHIVVNYHCWLEKGTIWRCISIQLNMDYTIGSGSRPRTFRGKIPEGFETPCHVRILRWRCHGLKERRYVPNSFSELVYFTCGTFPIYSYQDHNPFTKYHEHPSTIIFGIKMLPSLKLTSWWLGNDSFLLGFGLFFGASC